MFREWFDKWIATLWDSLPDLPDGMLYDDMMRPSVRCSVCGNLFMWPGEVDEYDENRKEHNYCGGSPRCCP